LVVAGDGPCQRDLEQAIAARQLGASVRLLGRRHDVPALMNACDLFVLSSDYEGLPLVIGEAMACETLVVATDCGGVREVLGDPAWLVPVRDRATLARRIAEAIEVRPAVRAALVAHQRERVEALFALPTLTRQWLDLYAASKA
jgi:glycosyltransferase involved in cell wall biosynthesis